MAWSIDSVLAGYHNTAAASTVVYTFAEAVPAGAWLIGAYTNDGFGGMTITVVDSRGNTYQVDVSASGSAGVYVFSSKLATAIQVGDTLTVTHSGGTAIVNRQLHLLRVSGLAATGWFDAGNGAATGTVNAIASNSVTAAEAGSLAVGFVSQGGTSIVSITSTSPWTDKDFYSGPNRASLVAARTAAAGSVALAATSSTSTQWRAAVAVYKAAVAAPSGPPPGSLALLGAGI